MIQNSINSGNNIESNIQIVFTVIVTYIKTVGKFSVALWLHVPIHGALKKIGGKSLYIENLK